ncbi:unnamed protein product, partial [Meganyctiphanes norvegica]
MLDMEEILLHVGKLGKFQIGIIALCCYASFVLGMPIVQGTFVYRIPFRCIIPSCDMDNSTYNMEFLNFTIPNDDGIYAECQMYLSLANDSCEPQDFNSSATVGCSNWVYNTTIFSSTTVTEFDLVCEKAWLRPMSQSAYMVGMLIGGITIGDLSDRFGRRIGISLAILLFSGGGIACTFVQDYIVFLVMRMITGAGGVSMFLLIFILAVEFVGKDLRTPIGILVQLPFSLGEATVGFLAIGIRDWRWLQLAITAPAILLLPYLWLMPESVRWLVSKGRNEEAMIIIHRVARVNNVVIPQHLLGEKDQLEKNNEIHCIPQKDSRDLDPSNIQQKISTNEKKQHTISFLDILRRKNMRRRTFILFFSWIAINLGNWGLDFNSGNLSGNIFVNFILIMLVELPSNAFMWLSLDRLGRKGSLSFTMILGGICCLVSGFIPEDMNSVMVGFNLVGKFGIASAFGIAYIYSAELFPTEYRSLGIGACSTMGRIGGIIAAPTAALASVYGPLPLVVFGVVATVAGAMVLLLPETYGSELPQTLDQSDTFGRDQNVLYFTCCDNQEVLEHIDHGTPNAGYENEA